MGEDLAYANLTHPELTTYDTKAGVNALFMAVSTGMILLMQAGFALVENGSVRDKNSKNILIKNMFDVCIGALLYWLLGYGFAFGTSRGGFIGADTTTFASAKFDYDCTQDHYAFWIFQFSFAATAATIVSGSLAERTKLPTYVVFSGLMTGFIYPVVVSWTWNSGGWLAKLGFADFAGTGIVHMVGGVAGFTGALILRPRLGKEGRRERVNMRTQNQMKKLSQKVDDPEGFNAWMQARVDSKEPYRPNSVPFVVVGTIILWVSWLFFNGGSTIDMYTARNVGAPKIMMNTIIAAATGGIVAAVAKPLVYIDQMKTFSYDVGALCNGALAGLVSITGACNNVQPWAAFIIGAIGGLVYALGTRLAIVCTVDDPIEASAVHGFCGMWGLIAVGFFDNTNGIFYGDGKDTNAATKAKFFFVQILGLFVITVWTMLWSGLFFAMAHLLGQLRVNITQEVLGLDIAEMDPDAIPHINELVLDHRIREQAKELLRESGLSSPQLRGMRRRDSKIIDTNAKLTKDSLEEPEQVDNKN